MQALHARFTGCTSDQPESFAEAAEALFADDAWATGLLAPLVGALREDPFFEPPLKVSHDRIRTGAILFDGPTVAIAASVVRADALALAPRPRSIVVPGRLSVTRYVRAGNARLQCWRAEPLTPTFSASTASRCDRLPARTLADGDIVRIDGRREGHLIARADRDLVMLTATIKARADPLMREYDVDDGRLIRVASADDRASRTEMLLGYLRRAGHPGAAERLEAATHDPAFHTRWAAMREWLALDAVGALPRLEAMADADPHDEVRIAATAACTLVRNRIAEAQRCPA